MNKHRLRQNTKNTTVGATVCQAVVHQPLKGCRVVGAAVFLKKQRTNSPALLHLPPLLQVAAKWLRCCSGPSHCCL